MRPGNVAMLVSETGGVRVQVTSPALGAANIRVQGMGEDRRGGTLLGRTVPNGTEYRQEQRTGRLDVGLTGEVPVDSVGTVSVRASAMAQKHRHRFGEVIENDRHRTLFAETSLAGGSKRTPWIAGLAYQRDT